MASDNSTSSSKVDNLKVCAALSSEERNLIVRRHYEQKGYRVHSGLQFGCELVLYADTPDRVHSDFCIHVMSPDGSLDWVSLQSLVRSMPELHKTLILAYIIKNKSTQGKERLDTTAANTDNENLSKYTIQEIAIATEHAPFRHKKQAAITEVGNQRKRQKMNDA